MAVHESTFWLDWLYHDLMLTVIGTGALIARMYAPFCYEPMSPAFETYPEPVCCAHRLWTQRLARPIVSRTIPPVA
jgi:hypothetical protein